MSGYYWRRDSGHDFDPTGLVEGAVVTAVVCVVEGIDSLRGYARGHLTRRVNGEWTIGPWPVTYPNGKPAASLVSIAVS